MNDAGPQIAWIEGQPHGFHGGGLPPSQRLRAAGDGQVGLIAGVVHGHGDRGDERDHHRHHHSFQIQAIAHMRGSRGHLSR